MISQRRTRPLATLLAAAALLAGTHSAHANDQDLRATTVPATSCQPASDALSSRVVLSNAAWIFNGTSTGTITFYCPLPINGNTESDASLDNDMSIIRVFYRDTDGMGVGAEVTARLAFRSTGLFAVGAPWSSNSSNVVVDTTAFHPLAHDLSANGLYSFIVTLSRTSTDESPAFTGIDFALPQVP
jgi:hypothetical protein